MTKTRIALIGSAMVSAALLCGVAKAQDYDRTYYDRPYSDRYYDDRASETVIVRPYDYDRIEKRQLPCRGR